MTINDIRRYLWCEYLKVGDILDDELDKMMSKPFNKHNLDDISLKKWAIEELCYRLQYDLCLFLGIEDFRETETNETRHIWYMEGDKKIFVDDQTFYSYEVVSEMAQSAIDFSDVMCDAANNWYKKSKMFNLASSIALATSEYLTLAIGGATDGYVHV